MVIFVALFVVKPIFIYAFKLFVNNKAGMNMLLLDKITIILKTIANLSGYFCKNYSPRSRV